MDFFKLITEKVQDFYVSQGWKRITIDKLLKDPFLDLEQVEKVKLSEALYEALPILI